MGYIVFKVIDRYNLEPRRTLDENKDAVLVKLQLSRMYPKDTFVILKEIDEQAIINGTGE